MIKKVSVIIVLVLALGIGLWSYFRFFAYVSIADIHKYPREYADKTVEVHGEVVDRMSAFVVNYYTLRDRSGEDLVVVTKNILPTVGTTVTTTGTVKEAFAIGSEQMLVLLEQRSQTGKP